MRRATRYQLINCAIAAGLVFFGAFSDGHISWVSIVAAVSASAVAFLTQLKTSYRHIKNKKAQTSPGVFVFYGG